MADQEKMLQEAVEAGQSGDQMRARELLLELLRLDNSKPLYWLLMSTCVDTKEEREYCLHNVLKLDPENSAAKHDLKLIGASLPEISEEDEGPELGEDWQTREIAAPKIVKKKKAPREEPWPLGNILAAIGAGLLVIFLGFQAVERGWIDLDADGEATPNSVPGVLINTSTATSASSNSDGATQMAFAFDAPAPTETAPVVIEPRDPSELIEQPFTPTPLVVNTPHPDSPAYADAFAAFQESDFEQAIALFGLHLASEPNSADGEYYVGLSFLALEDYENAWESFSRAIALSQQFAPPYVGRAVASQALGRSDADTITDLNSAILLDGSFVESFIERGRYYLGQGDAQRALEDLVQAEALAPASVEVQVLKAQAALALEDYEAARIAGERALDLDPTNLENYLVLSDSYLGLGELNAAIGLMQTYLSFEPESGPGWQYLGVAYERVGEESLAIDALDKALNFDPTLGRAAYHRALIHVSKNESSPAIPLLRVALEDEEAWFEPRIALAEARLQAGDPGSAFFEVNLSAALIETDEQRASFHYWRAIALEALGEEDTALADWESLLALPEGSVQEEWLLIAQERTSAP